MSDKLLVRSGYVYCVRRSGKTLYRLGHAPAGQLVDRLKKLAQTEENPTTLVLVGWIEVEDHVLAVRTLRETFHLYRLQDHWFDFRVTRSSELKSLLGFYADLMVKLPVPEPLIVNEPQPEYDRKFGFFEALHAANDCAYFPPDTPGIPVFPLPEKHGLIQYLVRSSTKINQTLFKLSPWTYGLGAMGIVGAVAIGLSSIYGLQASQSPHSMTNLLPSSKPSTPPTPQPPASTVPKPRTPKPTTPKPTTPKPITPKPTAPKTTASTPPESQEPMIWSDSSEGARLRSSPDASGNEIDFLPNGTPIVLGETSDAWQEIILPDGRRGWVFNDLIQN